MRFDDLEPDDEAAALEAWSNLAKKRGTQQKPIPIFAELQSLKDQNESLKGLLRDLQHWFLNSAASQAQLLRH